MAAGLWSPPPHPRVQPISPHLSPLLVFVDAILELQVNMTSHSTDQGTLAGGRGHSPRASSFRRDGYHSTRRPSSWACLQSSICLCSDQVATAGTQQSSPRVSVTLQCTENDRERHSLCVMNSRSDCTGYLLVSPCDFCGCQVNRQLPCVYCTLYCMYHVYCTVLYCTVLYCAICTVRYTCTFLHGGERSCYFP